MPCARAYLGAMDETPAAAPPRTRRRFTLWLVVLLLLLNLGAVSWLGYQHYEEYRHRFLDRAEQALIEGDREAAIRALSGEVQNYPEDREAAGRLKQLREEYRRRYLREAEASLRTGDKVGAVNALQQQIRHYPDDFSSHLELARLYTELDSNGEAETVYRDILARTSPDAAVHKRAERLLFKLIVGWSNNLKRQADRDFEQGDYAAALAGYDKVIHLRARNPALATNRPDRTLAVRAYNNVIAKRAFTLWLLDRTESPLRELASDYDEQVFAGQGRGKRAPPGVYDQRRIMLSNFYWDYADRLYRQESWQKAAEMYKQARQLRNAVTDDGQDPNTPALLLNYALSLYRAGDTGTAYDTLVRLHRDFPYHEKARVEELLKEVGAKVPASENGNEGADNNK